MGTYLLKRGVLMGFSCVTLRLSLRKRVYIGNLQWYSKRKYQTAWARKYQLGCNHGLGCAGRYLDKDDTN